MSNSFFVNIGLKLYKKLENSYDKSMLSKILNKIGQLSKNSFIVICIYKFIGVETGIEYHEKSLFINIIDKIVLFLQKIITAIYDYCVKISETSIVVKLSNVFLSPIKNVGKLANAIGFTVAGFCLTRIVFFTIRFGFDSKIILINGILLLGAIVLAFTDSENLDECIKNCLVFKVINWFFEN